MEYHHVSKPPSSLLSTFIKETRYKQHCPHLAGHFSASVTTGLASQRDKFIALQQFIYLLKHGLINLEKCPLPSCVTCGTLSGRLHLCLDCTIAACANRRHIHAHMAEQGHPFAVDVSTNELYCRECEDYVYDHELEQLRNLQQRKVALLAARRVASGPPSDAATTSTSATPPDSSLTAAWSQSSANGEPQSSEEEKSVGLGLELLQGGHAEILDTPSHLLGLRGLNNLGNTCFMSVILQSFVHNPILCNYFLYDMHNRTTCPLAQRTQPCLGCEVDGVFEAMFSGLKSPFSPHRFLFTTWRNFDYLAGYDQQDAHEFYVASLDGIHSHFEAGAKLLTAEPQGSALDSTNPTVPIEPPGTKQCHCVIHRVFEGFLESELVCKVCGARSTATDPFFDISLDISSEGANSLSNSNGANMEPIDLSECLRKFTLPEQIDRFKCQGCHASVPGTKQLTFKRTPVVISFHLKRFKQTIYATSSIKVERYVSFPMTLDLRPFLSGARAQTAPTTEGQESTVYDLFCVVNHHGKIDNGHYTCFVHHSGNWYLCDDHRILRTSQAHVLSSTAYLLFYVKRK